MFACVRVCVRVRECVRVCVRVHFRRFHAPGSMGDVERQRHQINLLIPKQGAVEEHETPFARFCHFFSDRRLLIQHLGSAFVFCSRAKACEVKGKNWRCACIVPFLSKFHGTRTKKLFKDSHSTHTRSNVANFHQSVSLLSGSSLAPSSHGMRPSCPPCIRH